MKIIKTTLQNSDQCEFGDFNVFIGGNGVGKTTFLLELYIKATGATRQKFLWIAEPQYVSDDISSDMRLLKSSLSSQHDGANLYYFSRATKNINSDVELSHELRFMPAEIDTIEEQRESSVFNNVKYRRPFIAISSCDARLGLPDSVESTGLNQPPQDPINVLHRNRSILNQIDEKIKERFQFNFILLHHTLRQLNLGVSKSTPPVFDNSAANIQDEFEKIERWKKENFTELSASGHGIRSMIRLLTSLLEPVNKVILIDEPEIYLYPSHKRWLGKQLVELAKTQGKQVFLVTHDPIILHSILDASTSTNIFVVERDEKGGRIRSCELTQSTDITPVRNQEQYLQGLFYQRCVIVEGASDRSFYQNMIDEYPEVADKDLGFVACNGAASSKHMAILVSRVGLQCSFIYDFDVILFQMSIMKEIYSLLGGQGNPFEEIENLFKSDASIQSAKDEKERKKAIEELTGYNEKTGLSDNWANANRTVINDTIERLEKVGIFLVPQGTLESWAPDVTQKVRFAELAPDAIRSNGDLNQRLKGFLKKVLSHLEIVIQ